MHDTFEMKVPSIEFVGAQLMETLGDRTQSTQFRVGERVNDLLLDENRQVNERELGRRHHLEEEEQQQQFT